MQGTNSSEPYQLPDTSRLKALTDGLFATVLTVLVLAFRLPEIENPNQISSDAQFLQHIVSLSPILLSYVLTFLVAGSYWMAHHRIFEYIPRTDRALLWYNMMFLLCVGLLPFSTQLVGAQGDAIAWSIYCINMILIGVMFTLEWGYAITHGLRDGEFPSWWAVNNLIKSLITPGVFLASLITVQFNTTLAFYFPILIAFLRLASDRVFPTEIPLQDAQAETKPQIPVDYFWRIAVYLPVILLAGWLYWVSRYYHAPK